MAEVDRRGFLRILRRSDEDDDNRDGPEGSPRAPKFPELADLTTRLLADLDAQDEELLAEGDLHTKAYDAAYMRVTSGHIVFSAATGFSGLTSVGEVKGFETEPPVEAKGYEDMVIAVLRFHHPADPDHVTRSFSFRFPESSPLIPAIRAVCNIPEPEPEPEEREEPVAEPPGS
jgi:hypothetical protein